MFKRRHSLRVDLAVAASVLLAGCASAGAPRATLSPYAAQSAAADSVVREAIRNEQRIQAAAIPTNTVTVLPLRVQTTDTTYSSIGFGLATLLATDLARSAKLVVVERLRLDAVMRELDLAATGRLDAATAPRVGRIIGARRIVVGDVTVRTTGALQIASRVANATTGSVDGAIGSNATMREIFDAEKSLAFRLFDALGVTLTPVERRAIERRPTQSLAAFLAFSRGVRAEQTRDLTGANSYYRAAVAADPNFTEASERLRALPVLAAAPSLGNINRAALMTTDFVNRSGSVLVGSGVDIPVAQTQQIVKITVTVGTP
jgi:TolB-like protein